MDSDSVGDHRGFSRDGPSFMAPALWTSGERPGHPLTAEDRAMLAEIATIVRYRKGERIYAEGSDASAVFNVITGIVKSYKHLPRQGKHIVGFSFPHDLIGLPDGGKYVNSAEAVTAVTLYRIPAAAFEARLRRYSGFDFQMICKLCHEIGEAQRHAYLLSRHRAVSRLGLFLRMLETQQGSQGTGFGEVFLPMSRSDIGAYTGITAETVSRSLRELAASGVIGFRDRRHVQITDRQRLETMISENKQA